MSTGYDKCMTGYDRICQPMACLQLAMIYYDKLWHGYDRLWHVYDMLWQDMTSCDRLASPITIFLCSSYFIKYIFKFSIVMTLNFAKSFYEYIKLSQSYMLVHVSTAAQCINVCM